VCKSGYSGDGYTCSDVNECLSNNGGCSANATCTNSAGSFSCACKTGYSGDGKTCTDVNECLTNNGGCGANGTCSNSVGSFSCGCVSGYDNCDGNLSNGCEINLTNNANHCGVCNKVCSVGSCISSLCSTGGSVLGSWGGRTWYKVQVSGLMSDAAVALACKNAGLLLPCQTGGSCSYNDSVCVASTPESSCGNPMMGLAQAICGGQNPSSCPALNGVYQYMGTHWISGYACGTESGTWCSEGNKYSNRFALCFK
jgi:hypothetical protein